MQIRFADRRPDGDYALVLPLAGKDWSSLGSLGDNRALVEGALKRQRFEGEAASAVELFIGGLIASVGGEGDWNPKMDYA